MSALHSNCIQTKPWMNASATCVSVCACVTVHTKRTYFYCFSSAGLLQNHSYNANMLHTCKIQNVKAKRKKKKPNAFVIPQISAMLMFQMDLSLAKDRQKNVRSLSLSLPSFHLVCVCLNMWQYSHFHCVYWHKSAFVFFAGAPTCHIDSNRNEKNSDEKRVRNRSR